MSKTTKKNEEIDPKARVELVHKATGGSFFCSYQSFLSIWKDKGWTLADSSDTASETVTPDASAQGENKE